MLKRRYPYVAFILALFGGLGQLYNGQGLKALLLAGSSCAVLILSGWGNLLSTAVGLAFMVVAQGGLWLFGLWDAPRNARTLGTISMKWYNRWYVYVAWIVVSSFLFDALRPAIDNYRSFKISSGSSIPTLRPGDFVIADLNYYEERPIARGDIVIFTRPDDAETVEDEPTRAIVKRIIALPGEKVEVIDTSVFINDKLLDEPYARWDMGGESQVGFRPTIVPDNRFFVLGDNRDHSKDSRFWNEPFVEKGGVLGKVLYIYFSFSDLSRVGMTVN